MNAFYQLQHLIDAIRYSIYTGKCPWHSVQYLNVVVNPGIYRQIVIELSDMDRYSAPSRYGGMQTLTYSGMNIVALNGFSDEVIDTDYKSASFISQEGIIMPKMRLLYVLARMRASVYSSSVVGLVE